MILDFLEQALTFQILDDFDGDERIDHLSVGVEGLAVRFGDGSSRVFQKKPQTPTFNPVTRDINGRTDLSMVFGLRGFDLGDERVMLAGRRGDAREGGAMTIIRRVTAPR